MSTPSVIVDIAIPIAIPRRSKLVVAAISARPATHDIPPATPCANLATRSSQKGSPIAKMRVAAARPTMPISKGALHR